MSRLVNRGDVGELYVNSTFCRTHSDSDPWQRASFNAAYRRWLAVLQQHGFYVTTDPRTVARCGSACADWKPAEAENCQRDARGTPADAAGSRNPLG